MSRFTTMLIMLAVIAGITVAAMPAIAALPTSGLVGYYAADSLSGSVMSWANSSTQPGAWSAAAYNGTAAATVLSGATPLGGNAVDLTAGAYLFNILVNNTSGGTYNTYSGMTILVVTQPTVAATWGGYAALDDNHALQNSNTSTIRYITPKANVISNRTVIGNWTILGSDMVNDTTSSGPTAINLYQTDYVAGGGRPTTYSWSATATAGNLIKGSSNKDRFAIGGNITWAGGANQKAKCKMVAVLVYNRVLSALERGDAIKALYTQYYGTWPDAWKVQGQVKDSLGNGISGATVAIVGGSSTTTDPGGNYILTPTESAGSYTLRASTAPVAGHGGPAYRKSDASITIDGSAGTTQNFTLADAWKVSGQVKRSADSAALSGATVAVVGGTSTTTTDATGNYYLYASEANGSYTLRASMPIGYWPSDFAITIDVSAGTTHDFSLGYKWRAQGYVQNPDGRKLIGAVVSVVGGTSSTTTDSAGNYYLLTTESAGSYTLRASQAPFVSVDVPITIDPSPSSLFNYNFTLPHGPGIHGVVTAANLPGNLPIPGAKVVATGNQTYEVYSDAFGYYYIPAAADVYDLEANKTSYSPKIVSGITVASASSVVAQDMPMLHAGVWDLAIDFSTVSDPNGQWSYGYRDRNADAPDKAFTVYSSCYTSGTYYKTGIPIWGTPYQVWVPSPRYAFLGKNTLPTISDNATDFAAYIEPGEMYWRDYAMGQDLADQADIRWTSPDERIIKVYYSIKNQTTAGGTYPVQLCKQGTQMVKKIATGFLGRPAVGYTDSVAPVSIPTYQTIIPVTTGDRIDFVAGNDDFWAGFTGSVALTATITTMDPSLVATCHTIADLKSQPDGKIVFMVTPVKLVSPSGNTAFDKPYGNPTVVEKSFYAQSDDRIQGIKLIGDDSTPSVAIGWKITFSGTVATVGGQKVVLVSSINSSASDTTPVLLGKGSKGVTASNTLVKVWGKIKDLAPNPVRDSETWTTGGNTYYKWDYEYMTITDGANDIKIPLHVQWNYMSTYDPAMSGLTIGDYVAVTGIATTTDGADVVVMPRGIGSGYADILNYTDLGY